ncbi:MAG TPA: 2-oxo-4-hydroxy-4-carboxy-5-ureidoimidazoline decarboxylase [Pyrinomonadaceae bacterium]
MNRGLERLNSLAAEEAAAALLKCCGSTLWARRMAAARPFDDERELLAAADSTWWSLDERDWLEAFNRHPKIGEKKAALAQDADARRWSAEEQAGTQAASQETKRLLAEVNREYEAKFNYIFIICATGKTSAEMLASCLERLNNDPATELRVAAEEQRLITHLRLQKLLEQ